MGFDPGSLWGGIRGHGIPWGRDMDGNSWCGLGEEWAKLRAICENPVVANEITVRTRDEGDQSFDELEWLEDDLGFSQRTGPGSQEAQEDSTILVQGEAVIREGSPQSVTAEAFEALSVGGLDGASRMQRASRERVKFGEVLPPNDVKLPTGEADPVG